MISIQADPSIFPEGHHCYWQYPWNNKYYIPTVVDVSVGCCVAEFM